MALALVDVVRRRRPEPLAARTAFTDAVNAAGFVGTTVALAAAVVAVLLLPSRPANEPRDPTP
jgi:hypothetical protein